MKVYVKPYEYTYKFSFIYICLKIFILMNDKIYFCKVLLSIDFADLLFIFVGVNVC